MNYIKKKRDKTDYCNICGQFKSLTWDHVPPKSVTKGISMNVNTLFGGMPTYEQYQKKYQSGLKFRSICSECNNSILGKNDSVYRDFSEKILKNLNNQKEVGDNRTINIPIQVNRLCRSIIGHMLAAKEFYDSECLPENELREYVLGEISVPNFNLYYWIYPYKTVFTIRDVVVGVLRNTENSGIPKGMISVMASFPIAYMITDKDDEVEGLHNLFDYCTNDVDEVVDIPVDYGTALRNGGFRHPIWPCNVDDEVDFILSGEAGSDDSRIGIPSSKY